MQHWSQKPPPAPEINKIIKEETRFEERELRDALKNREAILSGLDDLLISRGARLVLFLPIFVIFLFGLAQSYRGADPEWWEGSVRDLFFGLSFSKSVYLLSLVIHSLVIYLSSLLIYSNTSLLS